MAGREFTAPIECSDGRWTINLARDERELIVQLLTQFGELLVDDETPPGVLTRLFPPAFTDDEAKNAEYQRLMRDELVTSRLASLEQATSTLRPDGPDDLGEDEVVAFMRSLNSLRLVLGTTLGITDDDTAERADSSDSPEHQLYGYLGWLLEWTVRSLSPDIDTW